MPTTSSGQPDLKISKKGLLTATPLVQGCCVCREDRRVPGQTADRHIQEGFSNAGGGWHCDAVPLSSMAHARLAVDGSRHGYDRCITVTVSDADSEKMGHNFTENIRIRAIGLNFNNKT